MSVRTLPYIYGLLVSLAVAQDANNAYVREIQKWRDGYEARLKQDDGWLTLSGLFWLKEGGNTFGTGMVNDIVLPEGSSPDMVGSFIFRDGSTRLSAKPGAPVLLNGVPVLTEMPLKPDSAGPPDRITLGRLSMIVIHRGNRYGVRLWDHGSPARRDFRGTQWFPVDKAYRVTARFVSYPQPKMIAILNILGDTEPSPSPGYAVFEIAGQHCRLEPVLEDNQLFFIFKDRTSSKQTYPAGRFLYSALPKDGKVVLDFNKATNPPCAFTAYATCPLPPKQNYLPVAIDAGELNYGHAKP
ncbi:MAG TPA: DUF1684 domain-containing protein [Bryobacteraceae bacterium]|nr:DUF1684 domain-containing protein [Bryobacteraceae bacterium]